MTAKVRVLQIAASGGGHVDEAGGHGVTVVRRSDVDALSGADGPFDYVLLDESLTESELARARDLAPCPVILAPAAAFEDVLATIAPDESHVRDALGTTAFGVAIVGPTSRDAPVIWSNAAFERLVGIETGDPLGREWERLLGDTADASAVAEIRSAIAEVRTDSFVVRANDAARWTELTITPTPVDGETGFLVFLRDVTDRIERVRALRRQNRSLESLHTATETLLGATDFEEAAWSAIDGLSEGLGKELAGFWIQEDDGRLHPIAASPRSQEIIEEPPVFSEDDGSVAWQAFDAKETRYVAEMDEEPDRLNPDTAVGSELVVPLGEFGVLIVGSTEPSAFREEDVRVAELWAATVTMVFIRIKRERLLREREQEVRRERDRLDEFASLMSHDLRNPLTVANGYLELAADDVDSPHLERVGDALDRMETLISDMLTLAREGWQAGEPEAVDLSAAIDRAWSVAATRNATLTADVSVTIEADRSQLGQLLENLFDNAASHGSPDVTVRVGRMADGFYVEDDGDGIDPADREDLFETGYTTSDEGTGFGLAIVAAIADAHGWDVSVTDGTDGGARFEVRGVTTVPNE